MKKLILTVCIIALFGYAGKCQVSSAQDRLALQIPEQAASSTSALSSYIKTHFASDSERVRAIFVWVTNNISYDVERLRHQPQNERPPAAEEILRTRKGVCQGYADLFAELCRQCNIKAMVVPGYGKLADGTIADLAHAWAAAEVNNKWYLFDPTWSAGTVKNFQFSRNVTNRFYKISPEEMIKDHMPFDPMHQFLNYTFTYSEFNRGSTAVSTSKVLFNYADTIRVHNSLDTLNQFIGAARRITRNGDRNALVNSMLDNLNKNKNTGEFKIGFDGAVAYFNKAVSLYNRYVSYKNARFAATKDDKEILQMVDSISQCFEAGKVMLTPITASNPDQRMILTNFTTNFYRLLRQVDEEKIFLKRYLQTDRAARRM
jgi:hypothetical protein